MIPDWIIASATTIVVGLVAGYKLYAKFKKKLGAIVVALSEVDKALYDDKVTEEEFRTIFEAFKKVATDP